MKTLVYLRSGWWVLLVVVLAGAASAADPLQEFKFPIIDSGFPADDDNQRPFWLDNDRIIFYGIDVTKPRYTPEKWSDSEANRLGVGHGGFYGGFYVWNLRTGKIEPYRTGIARICVEDGVVSFIRLRTREDEVPTAWRGPLGREQQLPVSANDLKTQTPLYELPCIWPESLGRQAIRPLRGHFGTLAFGAKTVEERNSPVVFLPANSDQGVALPIRRSEFSPGLVRYIPWEGRYLIQESVSSSDTQARAWYLEKDGKTPFPRIPVFGLTSVNYFPIKGGVLVTAIPKLKDRRGYGTPTTYLLRGELLDVVGPAVGAPSLSPDGCRGAFVSAFGAEPNYRPLPGLQRYLPHLDWAAGRPGRQTIRVMELCS